MGNRIVLAFGKAFKFISDFFNETIWIKNKKGKDMENSTIWELQRTEEKEKLEKLLDKKLIGNGLWIGKEGLSVDDQARVTLWLRSKEDTILSVGNIVLCQMLAQDTGLFLSTNIIKSRLIPMNITRKTLVRKATRWQTIPGTDEIIQLKLELKEAKEFSALQQKEIDELVLDIDKMKAGIVALYSIYVEEQKSDDIEL